VKVLASTQKKKMEKSQMIATAQSLVCEWVLLVATKVLLFFLPWERRMMHSEDSQGSL
jgi:hypothetical protein